MSGSDDYRMDGPFMQEMRQIYLSEVDGKLSEIQEALRSLRSDPDDEEQLKQTRMLAHRLAGTGASYGFEYASRVGRRMEELSDEVLESSSSLSESTLDYLLKLFCELEEYFRKARSGPLPPDAPLPNP